MTPIKQTVYLPVKIEDELPTQEVCALNEHNMLVGHLKHLGKGVIRPIVYVEDEHQEMGNITHWLKKQEGYFFTPEQLNQFISNVIKDTLDTAAEKAYALVKDHDLYVREYVGTKYSIDIDMSEDSPLQYGCSVITDKESITSTFDITYKKHMV